MLRIWLWRLQHDLTQDEAATQLGLSVSSYALLERGLRPTAGQEAQLRQVLGGVATTLFDPFQERIEATR